MTAEAPIPAGTGARPWRALIRGFLTLLAGEGAARVLGLVSVILLARTLGPHGFGPIMFATSLLSWFWLVVDNGTQVATTSAIARDPSRFAPSVERLLGLRLALSLGAAAVLVVVAQVASNSEISATFYSLFAVVLPVVALNPRWLVLGVGKSHLLAAGNVASQAIILAGVVLLVTSEDTLNRVPFVFATGELVFAVVLIAGLRPSFGKLRPRVDVSFWRRTVQQGAPLMIGSASRGVMLTFDLLVIAYAIGPGAAGYYGAAVKPVLFASTVAGLFSLSLLASYSVATAEQASSLYRRSILAAGAGSLAAALCLSAGAAPFVDAVYGDAFEPAVTVLAILAWRVPFTALAGVYTSVLVAGDAEVALMRNNLAGAAVNAVGVIAAVKLVGIEGAAAVSVVAGAIILALNYRSAVTAGLTPRPRR